MAIVKATYTKLHKAIRASVAYYTTRPSREGTRGQRVLFGKDGPGSGYVQKWLQAQLEGERLRVEGAW